MTNELINLVKQFADQTIVNNPEVPDEKNSSTIESVTEGITGGLKDMATGGGLGQLINMFNTNSVNSSVTQQVETSVVNTIMDKVGLKNQTARQIASAIVPKVLSALLKLVKDPKSSTTEAGLLSSLTGSKGKGIDFQALLNKGLGGSDGKFDLNDAMSMLQGGGNNSSEGLFNKLGGLLGK